MTNQPIKIDKRITGTSVANKGGQKQADNNVICMQLMDEKITRPEHLEGATYKVKTPQDEHALYITINDMVLNEGTTAEIRTPYEIFFNTKNPEHYQWMMALSRIMSAVFRKGGDVTFLPQELKEVHDPRGGHWNGGRLVPSVVAEIGYVIERHMIKIGLLKAPELDEHQQQLVDSKREQYEQQTGEKIADSNFPPNAVVCAKCQHKAVVNLDNCMTCLNCGDSKCG